MFVVSDISYNAAEGNRVFLEHQFNKDVMGVEQIGI